MIDRRRFLLGALASGMAGCHQSTQVESGGTSATPNKHLADDSRTQRLSQVRKRAADWFASRQSPDGAFRSDIYGTFRDGTALTPLVLHALLELDPEHAAIKKAGDFLAQMVQFDGTIRPPEKHGFDLPLYSAALTITAFSHPSQASRKAARNAWLQYLRERQLTESLGWAPEDPPYGGWGYCHGIPVKPRPNEMMVPFTESNLSATTFALSALRTAGVPRTDPAFSRALTFVHRCQNWPTDEKLRHPRFDDGGFFFIEGDPVRNKAGADRANGSTHDRYYSYGSMTADGLRCLDLCSEPVKSERRRAAVAWLRKHFHPDVCPGSFSGRTDIHRQALYFYYAMSIAQAPLEMWLVDIDGVYKSWRESLIDCVMARQRPDGSWFNDADAFRENDPLVATSFACLALSR